jgi:replicative DNA helicase
MMIATTTTVLRDAVKGLRHADEAGGLAMLNALAECAAGTANERRHAEIEAEKAMRRALIAL